MNLPTLNEAKARRQAVQQHLQRQGYPRSFTEPFYQRLVAHDRLRRGRALVDALAQAGR